MTRDLDARSQLALLASLLLATLFGGWVGLAIGTGVGVSWIAAHQRERARALRATALVAPLALMVAALDGLAGRPAEGLEAGLRLLAVTVLAICFARSTDARAMAEGLRALRVPYPIVFVLVTGTRFIPVASADLADLTDAARLRGMTVSGTLRRRLADWSTLLVPLLVLTIHRGLQLGEAMEARGFSDGRRRASLVQLRWRVRDSIVVAIAGAGLAAVLALRLISG